MTENILIVDCSKPLGQQQTKVQATPAQEAEIAQWRATMAARKAEDDSRALSRAEVSKLHLVRALRSRQLLGPLQATLRSASIEVQQDWEAANTLRRDDPLVAQFSAALGLADDDLDAIWRAGQ